MRHQGYGGLKNKTQLTVGRHINRTIPGKRTKIEEKWGRCGGVVVQVKQAAQRLIQDSRKTPGSAGAMSAGPRGQNP